MTKQSKRISKIKETVDPSKFYTLSDALALAKQNATAKFDESIDIAVNLGIDAKKSDQLVKDLRNKTESTNPSSVLNGNIDQFIEEGIKNK